MSDKYLRKNEFRYDENPKFRNKQGKGHTVYVSVTHGDKSKVNAITHAKKFNGKNTKELKHNPEINSKYKTPSRVSKPFWEKNEHIKRPMKGIWRFRKDDKKTIQKLNRKAKSKDSRLR